MVRKREFVHLHLHTQFSLLDGAIKIKELPEYAKKFGYNAVAITDHGNLFGSFKFYKTLRESGLKPIIGIEAYITKGSRFQKLGKGSEDNYTDKQNHHIILLAKNDTGLKNLMKLSSKAFLEGFHYKPRIDLELLNEHREGLICLTACLKGLPTYFAAQGNEEEAEKWLLKLVDIFGKEDLYVELQPHPLEEQITANKILVRLAKKHGLKLVGTCDVHYLRPEDKTAHMILTALQMKKTYQELLNSPEGQKLQQLELHFASPEEVWRKFENTFDGWEKALLNTLEVAEKVSDRLEYFESKEYKMPVFEVPEGESLESYFKKLAIKGLKKRLKERDAAKEEKVYWERLEYELDVISKMGFPGYFLIVQDFINWAKENGIPVGPGRGCVLPNTPVMLGDGAIKPIKEVQKGDFVLTHRGAVLPVVNRFEYDVDEVLVKIKVGAEELTLTEDHKVLVLKTEKCNVKSTKETVCKPTCKRYCKAKPYLRYRLKWLEASKVNKDDFLVFPRQRALNKEIVFDLLNFVEKSKALRWDDKFIWYERGNNKLKTVKIPRFIKFEADLAKILGYFISEGYTAISSQGGVVGFSFHQKEENYAKELLELFEKVFNLKGKIYRSKHRNSLKVEFKSKIVAQFLRKLCGDKATDKRIPPEIVLKGKDEYVKVLIAYLFRGDGTNGRGQKYPRIKYSTVSKTLAHQLRLLLARFGFWGSIKRRKRKNPNWNDEFSVNLSGRQLLRWNETFKDFPITVPQQRFYRNDSFFVDDRFIFVKVRKVEKVPYKGKVYDITVPVDHSYTTSTVAIHNSAGGSLVAYALGITEIDPIKHDLLFERFLNPERVSMPDIDVDFCMDRRDDVIDYVRRKYGHDSVSQIITYNVLKSKSVIRDVCRAMGVPLEKADKLAKLIPQGDTQGSQLSLEEMTEWSIEELKAKYGERPDIEDSVLKFRQMIAQDPTLRKVVEEAKKLDGLTRHTGFHAAGVVIAPKPLIELVPLFARKEKDKETKQEKFIVATQYDMGVLEEIGLLKMDFLGLKTLTELDLMKKMVKDLYGEEIDFYKLDYGDPKVYQLLKSGKTTGVFQLESKGMQNLLIKLKPDRFDDIIAVLALYRPGPLKSGLVDSFVRRKHGLEPIKYDFPELEPILKESYGLCLTGDTEIILADGSTKTLEELVKTNAVGTEVIGVDEKDFKLKRARIKQVFDNGVKEVFELRLTNGLSVKATADHKFLTPEGWKELRELNPEKDLIAVPKYLPSVVTEKAHREIPNREPLFLYSKPLIVKKVRSFLTQNGISQRKFSQLTGVQRSAFFGKENPFIPYKVLQKVSTLLKDPEVEKTLQGEIYFVPIKEIVKVGPRRVYDLEIEDIHNFIGNGIICHNCIYQEQIMKMSQILAGFTPGEADTLRKGIGKKKKELIEKMRTKFIEGAVQRGYDRKKIEDLWNSIEKFASYSFNKSHSTAYAYISYWTAYMKTYYPGVFFAVKLSTEKNENKFIALIKDAKLFGFELLPPDINKSDVSFTIEEKEGKQYIRYGLAKIKGVGEEAAKAIKEAKKRFGEFKSLADFVKKVDTKKVNKKVIEALIEAGAFDFTGESREELLEKVRSQEKLTLAVGQNLLFAPKKVKKKRILDEEEFLERLKRERQLLGFYISGHPLDMYPHLLKVYQDRIEDLEEVEGFKEVQIPGVIVDFQEKRTRSGKYMAIFNLIDKTGLIECVVFPETYEAVKDKLGEDRVVVVVGNVTTDAETEKKKLLVERVYLPDEKREELQIIFKIPPKWVENGNLEKLKRFIEKLSDPQEGAPTYIHIKVDNKIYLIELGKEYWIVPSGANLNMLQIKLGQYVEILGDGS